MVRDQARLNAHRKTFEGTGLMDRLNFGCCTLYQKPITFIPEVCQIDTQDCFENRKVLDSYKACVVPKSRRVVSKKNREKIFERDGYKCLSCGNDWKYKLTIDHVIPLTLGGKNNLDNYQTLCTKCNVKKGTKETDYRSILK